ncbi:hypothetical protein [Reyranella sp.]|uniref:hypothetical protein n=1 Tax=Reyranella sp. TaxID=1929291 RepID=UPI003D126D76
MATTIMASARSGGQSFRKNADIDLGWAVNRREEKLNGRVMVVSLARLRQAGARADEF